jgi:hypothetical protein
LGHPREAIGGSRPPRPRVPPSPRTPPTSPTNADLVDTPTSPTNADLVDTPTSSTPPPTLAGVPADQELTADAVPDDTLDTVESGLDEVELALARLDAGTYGRCESCGAPLPEGVLAVAPTTRRCEACPP